MGVDLLMVFSITKGVEGMHLRGHYDGVEFIPKTGFCTGVDDLYKHDAIRIYSVHTMLIHTPIKYTSNLEKELEQAYIGAFGSQCTLNI